MKICSGRGITIGITGLQENIGRGDLIEVLYWDTPIYTNETINFQIWPSAIVGAGSFWNYQSKLTPDSKEFTMMINTQHKVSHFVRFMEQLICRVLIGQTYCLRLVRSRSQVKSNRPTFQLTLQPTGGARV